MCHVLLLMPVIALPAFWLMPLAAALPVYLVIAVASFFTYYLVIQSMRKPVQTGMESIQGATGQVVAVGSTREAARYLVRLQGEVWNASCDQDLARGQRVRVAGIRGVILDVNPLPSDPPS